MPNDMTASKRRHGRSAGKPGQYQHECGICHSTFARAEHLSRHKRTVHSQEKKFKCDICGKTCSRSDNLRQHRKTHRSASKMDIDTEDGDSEEENYARDDKSIENNWEDEQPELDTIQPVNTDNRNDEPVIAKSARSNRRAATRHTAEPNITKRTPANDSNLTNSSVHKPSNQDDAELAAAVPSGDDNDNEKFKEDLNSILEWVWERFPPELAPKLG